MIADIRIAISVATQVESIDVRAMHIARARAMISALRADLDGVDRHCAAIEAELVRTGDARQLTIPGAER